MTKLRLEKLRAEGVDRLGTLLGLMTIGTGIVAYPQFEVFLVLQQCQVHTQQFIRLENASNVFDDTLVKDKRTLVMPEPSRLLASFGPRPGTSLSTLSFKGSPVKSRNFCEVVDDMMSMNLEKASNTKVYSTTTATKRPPHSLLSTQIC